MRIQNAQAIIMQKIWARFVVLFGVIGTMVGLWFALGCWGVVAGLALLLGLAVTSLLRNAVSAQFTIGVKEVQMEATKLLEDVEENLCYYGGVGFIGDYPEWQRAYDDKLKDERIHINRFLDVKPINQMKKMLKGAMKKEAIEEEVDKYEKWLRTHCDNLEERIKNNCFYHFEGAPIWKYGVHCIIFDNKHVVIPFISSEGRASNAIFIRNCPEIATELVSSLDWIRRTLKRDAMSSDELAALVGLPERPARAT